MPTNLTFHTILLLSLSLFSVVIGYPSAVIYLIVYLGIVVLTSLINKRNRYILLFVTLLLLSVFVGLRDFGVGYDTEVYIKSYFYEALRFNSLKDLLYYNSQFDLGFLLFAKIATLFGRNPQYLLVCIEVLICFFTFAGILELNTKCHRVNYSIFILLWLFSSLNNSMNLMRQFCAIAILMCAYCLLINGKWKKSVLCQVLAYFFHSSSIVFIPVYIFYYMSLWSNEKMRNILTAAFLVVSVLLVISILEFIPLLFDYGLISESYAERYGDSSLYDSANNFGVGIIALFLLVYVSIYYSKKKNIISSQDAYLAFIVTSFSLILRLSAFSIGYLSRLSHDYYLIMILYVSIMFSNKKFPIYLRFPIYVCIIYLWYREFVFGNAGETYPYHSSILAI